MFDALATGVEEEVHDLDEEVQELNRAWQTEVHCPEVLPFKRNLIESITARIRDQQVSLTPTPSQCLV